MSRRIEDLNPRMQKLAIAHIELCAKNGIDLLIYCTLRSVEEQARIYRQSRSKTAIDNKMTRIPHFQYPGIALKDLMKPWEAA